MQKFLLVEEVPPELVYLHKENLILHWFFPCGYTLGFCLKDLPSVREQFRDCEIVEICGFLLVPEDREVEFESPAFLQLVLPLFSSSTS